MDSFKDFNRICKYPKCKCTEDDNCSTRLLEENNRPLVPVWMRIAMIFLLITVLLLGGCSKRVYSYNNYWTAKPCKR